MKRTDRRSFLVAVAGTAAAALVPSRAQGAPGKKAAPKARRGVLIGALKGVNAQTREQVHALNLIDLDTGKRASIPLSFFAHGYALDPKNPRRAMIFEKRGPGAAEVDLRAGAYVRPLETIAGRAFYGHGVFSSDGSVLFVAENHLPTKKGLVSIWDGRTLASLGEFPTYGENPHDCILTDGGKTLVITNGGGNFPDGDAPCVTIIDVASRKLLDRRTFTNPRINAGHVELSKRGDMAVVSAPLDGLPNAGLGAISLGSRSAGLVTMTQPEEVVSGMVGETLSISIHESSRIVAATSPLGDQLSFWTFDGRKHVNSLRVDNPRGVTQTLDREYFVVCHGAEATLSFFSTKTLEHASQLTVAKSGIAGSHLYTWAGRVS